MLIIDGGHASDALRSSLSDEAFNDLYIKGKGRRVLYIHFPYCPQKCRYCVCKSRECPDGGYVDEYVQKDMLAQIEKARDILEQVCFEEIYIGGGTPTYASAGMLEALFRAIPNLEGIPNKCIEGSPNTLAQEHLDLLKAWNFDYLSLGIQSLQEDICKWQNRYYITREQAAELSEAIRSTGMYFNYDLICYLGRGDIRDIPGFREDLLFLMQTCLPSSICIHQLHQTTFTREKMLLLYQTLREAIECCPEYECINAELQDQDAVADMMYEAEFRLVRERRDYTHHMWNKFPGIPVPGYDVYALGGVGTVRPKSNVGELVRTHGTGRTKIVRTPEWITESYHDIRRRKGLEG